MKLKSIKEKQAETRSLLFIKKYKLYNRKDFKFPATELFTGNEDRQSPTEKENPEHG